MFERFTRDARAALKRAEAEASALGHDRIGAEHLLLALAGEGGASPVLRTLGVTPEALRAALAQAPAGGLDANALASIGIDLDAVRRRVEASFGPGALARAGGRARPRFTGSAKQALEQSLREALALRHNHIGPEHILLGVVRAADGAGAEALHRCGTSAEAVRAATLAALRSAA